MGQVRVGSAQQIQQTVTILRFGFQDAGDFAAQNDTLNLDHLIEICRKRIQPVIASYYGLIVEDHGSRLTIRFPDAANNALQAAIALQRDMSHHNGLSQAQPVRPIDFSIGLHTGPEIPAASEAGPETAPSAISDPVHVAATMQALTSVYGASVIVSEATLARLNLDCQYQFRFLDKVRIKGEPAALSIFEIFDGDPRDVIALKIQSRKHFSQGLFYYLDRSWGEASHAFRQALAINPADKAAALYLARVTRFIMEGVPAGWEGIGAIIE